MSKILSFLVISLVVLYVGAWYYELTLPVTTDKDTPSKIIFIEPGTPLKKIASLLEREGLIKNKWIFIFETYRLGLTNQIKAGEYELSPREPLAKILETLVQGRVVTHYVTIPEGYNIYEIARLLDKAGLCSRNDFLQVVQDKEFLKKFNIPGDTAEGFLFPDTYAFWRGISCRLIVATMIKRFWEVWNSEFAERAKELGLSVKEVVTLASIVEKEAVMPQERPIIASVFWNRLKRGMKLQSDPTVRYAVKRFYSRLRYRDLRYRDPYNTYIYPGLPPGPICNPGKASIKAVLYPAKTDYLYFVSKGDGTHYFSRTLREHERAVDIYQRGIRPRKSLTTKKEKTLETQEKVLKSNNGTSEDTSSQK
ncbi:aminodeoxychorismate lyase [Thermodesulfatator indicus DSM 15286]|uniref:Endolytic murein transglycosylase n=1 Tax=Thermodesulfatator indicus (strain DSM 15286 / JCM 11887 / CIR29812) TaxID=667014 RepID=F8A8Z3_THEID|nr:endolytic transglycosylase MltG [Thermodesulfatator indicus]AEH44042.1 aminodeoxychorismate lyase [Thermodesulfatator indicus DSM 15286]